ncbi:MAG: hypothetical protein M1438_09540 [Deltaproteobacteria bacterium]|nr:hypothetical protein [Deltaproteobacteria bacterium]
MSQHKLSIDDGSGAEVLARIDAALQAQASMQAGAVGSLSATFANQLIADTTSGHILKRNNADDAWDYLAPIDQSIIASAVGTDAYAITLSPAINAYKNGVIYRFKADVANTGACTLNINAQGAVDIKRYVDGALADPFNGDIPADGLVLLLYDSAAGVMVLLNPANVSGAVVQVVNTQSGAYASGNTQIPLDDTIPQKTEGDEYLTLAITPKSASHYLRIQAVLNVVSSGADNPIIALFQDAAADALAANVGRTEIAQAATQLMIDFYVLAGTTSATTFKIRAGSSVGGGLGINGASGARKLGGVYYSFITITEIKA